MKQMRRKITGVDLSEMSFKRKDLVLKIGNLSYPISNHIIKLLVWKDEDNYNKHLNDIESWLKQIQPWTLKGSSKTRPSKNDYIDWLIIDGYYLNLEKEIERMNYFTSYQSLPRTDLTISTIQKLYKKIIERSSDLLSKNALDDFERQVWNKVVKRLSF